MYTSEHKTAEATDIKTKNSTNSLFTYLFRISVVVVRLQVSPKGQDIALFARFLACRLHQLKNVDEIFGYIVVFLQKHHEPRVISRDFQLIEDPIRFPPPVVLRLGELCLPVMSVKVRVQRVVAFL